VGCACIEPGAPSGQSLILSDRLLLQLCIATSPMQPFGFDAQNDELCALPVAKAPLGLV